MRDVLTSNARCNNADAHRAYLGQVFVLFESRHGGENGELIKIMRPTNTHAKTNITTLTKPTRDAICLITSPPSEFSAFSVPYTHIGALFFVQFGKTRVHYMFANSCHDIVELDCFPKRCEALEKWRSQVSSRSCLAHFCRTSRVSSFI